jgi:hypothetical protein
VKIGILYIATGRYIVFWKDFYQSFERYFIPEAEKQYFVFTDSQEIPYQQSENVKLIPHEKLGWPFDTLMRFDIFLKAEENFDGVDYLFFFNANIECIAFVTAGEFLPNGIDDFGLACLLHPGYFNSPATEYPYEREQKASTAYMNPHQGTHYFMGSLNGGIKKEYLQLIYRLRENVNADIANNIIACWHDESHLNKYLADKTPKILSPSYGYPEGSGLPFEPKIVILDKRKFGGHAYLRKDGQASLKEWIYSRLLILIYMLKL